MLAIERDILKWEGAHSKDAVSFLDHELRSSHSFSVREEYPALFREFPGGESLVITHEEKVVAHVGYVVREFQSSGFRMKIGLIGLVATAHEFRGQGLASRLLKKAFEELKLKGCLLSLLWSDNSRFYYPLGFHRAGRERGFKFSFDSVPDSSSEIGEATSQDVSQIWRLYQRHSLKIDRSLEEQKLLLQIPQTKTFVVKEKNAVTAYAVLGKGADFTGYLHEWGGDLENVLKIVSHCQKNILKQEPLTLIAPENFDLNPIRQYATERWEGVVALFKILDRTMLLSLYENYLNQNEIPYHWNRENNGIVFDHQEIFARNDEETLHLLFGQGPALKTHPELPFYLWGFDSI